MIPLFAAIVIGIASYVAFEAERDYSARFAAISILLLIADGALVLLLPKPQALGVREAFATISLYWFLLPLSSGLILTLTARLHPLDAVFESLSALSGAGFTFIKPEEAPRTVVLWRSVLQWLGGISIVVFGGAVLPMVHGIIRSIYAVEMGVKLSPTVLSTIRVLLLLYVGLSFLSITLLFLSGMSLFDAVNNGLTAFATGGMSTKNDGFSHWYLRGEHLIIVSAMIMMILGAINFGDLFMLSRGDARGFLRSPEVRGQLLLLGIAVLVSVAYGTHELLPRLFNAISAITTTGFQIGKIEGDGYKMALIALMAIGGATFSTAAGLKIKRTIVVAKTIYLELSRPLAPSSMTTRKIRVGDREISEREALAAVSYALLYVVVLLFSSFLAMIILSSAGMEYNYIDVLFETTSALSCVGLSVGIISPELPASAKVLYMILIYLGRIEMLPLYLIIGSHYRAKVTL